MRYLRVSRRSSNSGGGGVSSSIPENGEADISGTASSDVADQLDELDPDDVEAGVQSVRTRRRPVSTPTRVRELSRIRVTAIAFGYGHTLALTEAGQVFSKGYNDRGQLGIGSRMAFVEYQRVYFTTSSAVGTGDDRSVAHQRLLRNKNNNNNEEEQQHHDSNSNSYYSADSSTSDDDLRIVSVACGSSHNMCLAQDGRCFVFGGNSLGQLGLGPGRSDQMLPHYNDLLFEKCGPCKVVACGSNHSAVISENGNLFSWGHSEYGQHGGQVKRGMDLAHGQETKFYHSPREVQPFVAGGPELVSLSCGYLFNLAQDAYGRVWSWGWDSHGALGLGAGKFGQHPQQIESLDAHNVRQVTAGHYHAMALAPNTGSRFAMSLRPLFVQDAAEATLWATELGEHFDIDIISDAPSWDVSSLAGNRRSSVGVVSRMRKNHKPIKAHRFIVFSRCSKLADMFIKGVENEDDNASSSNSSSSKTKTSLIRIPGKWEPLVVKSLVQYLYIDQIRDCPPHRLSELSSLAIDLGLPRLAALATERNAAERRHMGEAVGRVLADIALRRYDDGTEEDEGDETNGKANATAGVPASTFVQDMTKAVNNEALGDVRFALSEPKDEEDEFEFVIDDSPDNDDPESKTKAPEAPEVVLMHANRVIMTRFPFFMKLLNSGFAESMKMQRGEAVPLTGVSRETFATLLQWMYTGDRSGIDESSVVELMEAARLFEIDILFRICEAFVSERVDLDNAPDLLKVADAVKSQRIERCCKYLLEQATEVAAAK